MRNTRVVAYIRVISPVLIARSTFRSIEMVVAAGPTQASDHIRDFKPLDQLLEEFRGRKDAVIPILQRAQDVYGYLPRELLRAISQRTRIPISRLYGVATFYAQFRLTKRGRHLVRLCDGTACHVRGAPKNVEAIRQALGV